MARRKVPTQIRKEQIWAKVQKTDTCWLWTGCKSTAGYGVVVFDRVQWSTHRLIYTWVMGEIPEDYEIDHVICANKECCNPSHLEAVPPGENSRRAHTKTECVRGHSLDDESNLYYRRSGGRSCKACQTIRSQEYKRRKRAPSAL